jgi:hypothetical protein
MTGAAAPSVELTVYGEAAASDANVVFPFDLALPAARDLWALAESVRTSKTDLTAAQATVAAWKGPHRDAFDTKVTTYGTSAESVAAALEALANGIAAAWAAARGQQNRINRARYVEHEKQNEGARGWGVVEFFAGEVDYGPPPGNPPVPPSPGFPETGDPVRMHPEFGP